MKQDAEILSIMYKIYLANPKLDNEKLIQSNINFNNSVLFEEEFGRKLMDFILGYVLSQNTVAEKILSTPTIDSIADNFLHIFSNVSDPYLKSLKLLNDYDIINHFSNSKITIRNNLDITVNSLKKIFVKVDSGISYGNEDNLLEDLIDVLDTMQKTIYTNNTCNYMNQYELFEKSIQNYVIIVFSSLIPKCDHNRIPVIFNKITDFLMAFLKENTNNICVFFQQYIFILMDSNFKIFPELTIDLWISLFNCEKQVKRLLQVNDYMMNYFIDYLYEIHDHKTRAKDKNHYILLQKILTILDYFLLDEGKFFDTIPEYDLDIQIELVTLLEDYKTENLADYYSKTKAKEKDETQQEKFNFLMKLLKVIYNAMKIRFSHTTYIKIEPILSLPKLKKFIEVVGDDFELRIILLHYYELLHIDMKDGLLNERFKYYHTKPPDMQYEEG